MGNTRIWVLSGILSAILIPVAGIVGGLGCMGFYNGVSTSVIARSICVPLEFMGELPLPLVFIVVWIVLGLLFNLGYTIKNKNNAPLQ